MWWIIGLVIAGIYGIAQKILESLQQEVAVERKRWEDTYQQVEKEVQQQQKIIEQKLQISISHLQYQEIAGLHSASIKIANTTYELLQGARKTLDAMGRAIVETAKQRKVLENRKHQAIFGWGDMEKQIIALHKLRDDILIPDKDKVKAQRDHLLQEVHVLNQQTAELRDLKNRLRENFLLENWTTGIVKWFDQQKGFGFISQQNGESDIYFNKNQLMNIGLISQGDQVKFILRMAEKPWAERITKID
jgi:cold shock protein